MEKMEEEIHYKHQKFQEEYADFIEKLVLSQKLVNFCLAAVR